ncbi:hypothetical protein [Aquidulcibacter sp.]|jgi:hypothetical protein|uniref:hypothetical protein n=1 Tax=Aquidulcibacter sp. TaxID=2052990 RepID=UPI00378389AE
MSDVIQRRSAVLINNGGGRTPVPEPHKADYSAPITDQLLEEIDSKLSYTQEQLAKGRIISRFAW